MGDALPGARVVAAPPLTSGLRNTNYRLDLAGGDVVGTPPLRGGSGGVRPRGGRPRGDGRPSAGAAGALLGCLGRAAVRAARSGWTDGRWTRSWAAADAATAAEIAAACGAVLARIHEIHFPTAGFLGPQMSVIRPMPAWGPAVLKALDGRVEERLGPELSDRVRATVDSNARAVEPAWSEAVLVHADFRASNLLVREGAKSSGARAANRAEMLSIARPPQPPAAGA